MAAPFIPSYLLEALARCDDDRLSRVATQTLAVDEAFRGARERRLAPPIGDGRHAGVARSHDPRRRER